MKNGTIRRSGLRGLAIALVLGATAACGPLRHRGSPQERAVLSFTNESLDQADVYAVTPVQAIRIGTVMAGRTEDLIVPAEIAARGENVNVVARLLAQRNRPQSGPISVRPGERLAIRLPMDQRMLVVLPGH
jgi:hypothetical protein